MRRKENERNRKLPPASRTKEIVSEPSSRYAVPAVMRETLMPAMARNLGGRRLHDRGRSDEVCRRADVEQTPVYRRKRDLGSRSYCRSHAEIIPALAGYQRSHFLPQDDSLEVVGTEELENDNRHR